MPEKERIVDVFRIHTMKLNTRDHYWMLQLVKLG